MSGSSSWAPSASEKPFIEKYPVHDVDVAKKVGDLFRYPEQLDKLDTQRKVIRNV
jgi:hypothetical protein